MKNNFNTIKRRIIPSLKRGNVKRASIFGSYSQRNATTSGDLDLLIEFQGKKSLIDLARLKLGLEKLLKIKVDLITYKSLHPLLKEQILKEQKRIL
ncbi:MAG: nucleotidyltransferase domain-containing protein [Elusimicrobiota bacterium]